MEGGAGLLSTCPPSWPVAGATAAHAQRHIVGDPSCFDMKQELAKPPRQAQKGYQREDPACTRGAASRWSGSLNPMPLDLCLVGTCPWVPPASVPRQERSLRGSIGGGPQLHAYFGSERWAFVSSGGNVSGRGEPFGSSRFMLSCLHCGGRVGLCSTILCCIVTGKVHGGPWYDVLGRGWVVWMRLRCQYHASGPHWWEGSEDREG